MKCDFLRRASSSLSPVCLLALSLLTTMMLMDLFRQNRAGKQDEKFDIKYTYFFFKFMHMF